MSKIGIFGGTFNPPHIGHTRLAEHFTDLLKLDRLIVIPTAVPPHKVSPDLARGEDRMNMCLLSFPDAVVSNIELVRGGKSYTYDTLCEICRQYPGDELYFIVGSDMLLSFDRWYKYEEILDMVTLCAADREDDNSALKQNGVPDFFKGKKLVVSDMPAFEISSTELRKLIKNNMSTDGLLDPAVRAYIDERGLYR